MRKCCLYFSICWLLVSAVTVMAGVALPASFRHTEAQPFLRARINPIMQGELVRVDIDTKTLIVSAKNEQVTVVTDDKTVFTLDGETVTLVDLKPGMKVRIEPDTGTATRVTARSTTPAKTSDSGKKHK